MAAGRAAITNILGRPGGLTRLPPGKNAISRAMRSVIQPNGRYL